MPDMIFVGGDSKIIKKSDKAKQLKYFPEGHFKNVTPYLTNLMIKSQISGNHTL